MKFSEKYPKCVFSFVSQLSNLLILIGLVILQFVLFALLAIFLITYITGAVETRNIRQMRSGAKMITKNTHRAAFFSGLYLCKYPNRIESHTHVLHSSFVIVHSQVSGYLCLCGWSSSSLLCKNSKNIHDSFAIRCIYWEHYPTQSLDARQSSNDMNRCVGLYHNASVSSGCVEMYGKILYSFDLLRLIQSSCDHFYFEIKSISTSRKYFYFFILMMG